jgi:hypothetical protein
MLVSCHYINNIVLLVSSWQIINYYYQRQIAFCQLKVLQHKVCINT